MDATAADGAEPTVIKASRRMPRALCNFRQGDVTKAVKAVVAAGLSVARVEIEQGGKIVITTAGGDRVEQSSDALDKWMADRAREA
jgi:hypothetical protein